MSDTSVGTVSIDLKLDGSAFDRALTAAEVRAQTTGRAIDGDLSAATKRTEQRFSAFGSVATRALAATGVAAGIAGVASVKMAGDFQQSLNVFESVTGATAQQMAQVAARARQLGLDISLPGISAKDAALAMTALAKAGLDVNQSLAASKGVLSLAKAGNLDVADAAAIAARALNAFGLAGSEAVRVADLLAAAANASSADVADISLGLAQVGAGAKQMGVGLGDTVTALALFTNAGIRGQDAGTSLKQMFIQLAAPTKQAGDLMKQLGLNFFDAKGNFVGLETSAGLLQTKLAGLSQEQRNNALATIFGSDSMRVAAILADQGATGFDKMAKAVNRQGAATQLAAAQNAGFNGALDNFISTLQTIAIDLGTRVLPPLTTFLKAIAQPEIINRVAQAMAIFGSAVAGVATAVASVKLGSLISDLAGTNLTATSAGRAIAAAGALVGVSFGWAVVIVAAIAAVVAALVFLQVKFDIFGKAIAAIQPLINFLSQVFQAVADVFVASLQPALANLQAAFGTLFVALQPYVPYLKILAEVLGGALVGAIIATVVISAVLISALANFIAIIIRVTITIQSMLVNAFQAIASTLNDVVHAVTGINLVQAGRDLITGLIRGITDNAAGVVNKIKEICLQALNAVKAFFGIHSPSTVMADLGENLMKGLAQGITKACSQATGAMSDVSAGLQAALSVPQGSIGLTADASIVGGSAARSLTQNNVYNVYNQTDAALIANETAWRAQRA
jgi:TP901 family phage tail tape measure protein